jgi:hypothetical protein
VLRAWTERSLADLLEAHGLHDVAELRFPNDGWSGATLTRLVRPDDGVAFVLKRTSWATDWIARSTRDHALREGFVAGMPIPLAPPLVAPYYGAAADGTSVAILMPDLSTELLGWERPDDGQSLPGETIERVLQAFATLHAMPWPVARAPDAAVIWPSAPLRERLLLLSPRSGARLAADGVVAGERFVAGWAAFDRQAPASARDLIHGLDRDPEPLLAALDALPRTVIHGDLKLANVAITGNGRVALIDWQMTALAPIAVELGWLLVSNSAALAERPADIVERYRDAVVGLAGRPVEALVPFDASRAFSRSALEAAIGVEAPPLFRTADRTLGDWDLQLDLCWIVGLLLRGWRKGLDAEARGTLPSGVTASEDLGWWCARAVEAAGRRL